MNRVPMFALNATRSQRGFGMVELMVGLVVSMLIGLAALGSAQFIMAMQRQSVGAGSALGNATTANAALKYEIANAGLGLFKDGAALCDSMNFSVGATSLYAGVNFVPLNVSTVAGSQALDVFYATSLNGAAPSQAASEITTGASDVELSNYLPVVVGQAVLLAPPAGSGMPCTVRTATAVTPSTSSNGMVLTFAASGVNNQVNFTAATYPAGSTVSMLQQLQWTRFRVNAGDLVMEHPQDGTSAVLASNVVDFRVQYGITDGITTALQSWQDPQGAWASVTGALMPQITALRVNIVTRSPQKEKPAADGTCSASTAQPTALGTPLALTATDWQCYRYRSSVIIVPLRNVELGSAA